MTRILSALLFVMTPLVGPFALAELSGVGQRDHCRPICMLGTVDIALFLWRKHRHKRHRSFLIHVFPSLQNKDRTLVFNPVFGW